MDESPYPTQQEIDAEDAQELHRLTAWLRDNREDTRLAGENCVDWAIRLLSSMAQGKQNMLLYPLVEARRAPT